MQVILIIKINTQAGAMALAEIQFTVPPWQLKIVYKYVNMCEEH